ncbi:hypothetical protein CQZ88_20130, partial [Rhodococcus sp. ENV425]
MTTAADVGGPLVGIAGFTRALAAAGLPVASDAAEAYVRALREIDLGDRRQVYWTGRATLCHDPDDIPRYDLAFESWFGGTAPGVTSPQTRTPRRARIAGLTSTGGDETAGEGPELRVAADDADVLRRRDIAELSDAERAHLAELIATLHPRPP